MKKSDREGTVRFGISDSIRRFFLAIIPERLKKTLSQISIISNKQLSRIGLVMMAIGVIIIGVTDI